MKRLPNFPLFTSTTWLVPVAGSLSILVGLAAIFPTPHFVALAQPMEPGMHQPGMMMMDGPHPMLEQLDLTTDQQEQIRTLHEAMRTETESLRQQLQEGHEEMRSLLASEDATDDQLRQHHQDMQQLRQQLASQHFEMMLSIREILTPEQRASLAEMEPPGHHRGPQR